MAARNAQTIGIRDLLLHAPRLVKRAARGERIVIRYGKARATLQPEEPVFQDPALDIAASSPETETFLKEKAAFEAMSPRTLKPYKGRYVAVHEGKIIAADADAEALYERMSEELPDAVVFVGKVGDPDEANMPGFEVL